MWGELSIQSGTDFRAEELNAPHYRFVKMTAGHSSRSIFSITTVSEKRLCIRAGWLLATPSSTYAPTQRLLKRSTSHTSSTSLFLDLSSFGSKVWRSWYSVTSINSQFFETCALWVKKMSANERKVRRERIVDLSCNFSG